MDINELQERTEQVVRDASLSYRQRVQRLAGLAEDSLPYPPLSDAAVHALDKGLVCDLFEGHAPYRPRYTLPDYALALRQGSAYLELPPPRDLDEALAFLLVVYSQVPSITGYPVWFGPLDVMLEPFAQGVSDDDLYRKLRLFWRSLDRMFPDAFAHANLGPDDTRVGRAALRLERDLRQVVPNLTLMVDPERTPDSLVLDAVDTVFAVAKPHFVNHPMLVEALGDRYGVVSCYNSLPAGGGSHTLVRLNLREAVLACDGGVDVYLGDALPRAVELTAEVIEARIRFLVEEAKFYEHSWLVHEGLLDLSRFGAMFGVFGLAEAVTLLLDREGTPGRYGQDRHANELSYLIIQRVAALVAERPMPFCEGGAGHCFLHAQSGIDSDEGVTAGTRVPIGQEPSLYDHLRAVAPHHHWFTSGVSDIVHVDETAVRNPRAVLDVIRGAFRSGMREFTFNLDGGEFVRITGYLVRRSDLAHVADGVRHASAQLAAGSMAHASVDGRRVQRVASVEQAPGG